MPVFVVSFQQRGWAVDVGSDRTGPYISQEMAVTVAATRAKWARMTGEAVKILVFNRENTRSVEWSP